MPERKCSLDYLMFKLCPQRSLGNSDADEHVFVPSKLLNFVKLQKKTKKKTRFRTQTLFIGKQVQRRRSARSRRNAPSVLANKAHNYSIRSGETAESRNRGLITWLGGASATARRQRLFCCFHRGFYFICSHIGIRLEPSMESCAASAGRKTNNGSSECGLRSARGHMTCHAARVMWDCSRATCSHCTPTH